MRLIIHIDDRVVQADPAAGAKQDKAARKEARREVKRAQREAEIAAARAVLAAARAKGAAAAAAANPAPDPAAERGGKRRRRDEGDHDRDGGDHRAKHGGSHARDGSDHRTERRDRSGEHSGRHANGKAADGGVERDGARNGGAEPRVHHDAASAQGRDLRYGLNHADAVQGYDRRAPTQRCMRFPGNSRSQRRMPPHGSLLHGQCAAYHPQRKLHVHTAHGSTRQRKSPV